MVNFLRKSDAASILLITDNQISMDTTNYDNFPVIVAYPVEFILCHNSSEMQFIF